MEGLLSMFKGKGMLQGALPKIMGKDKFKEIITKPRGLITPGGRKQIKSIGGAMDMAEKATGGIKETWGG